MENTETLKTVEPVTGTKVTEEQATEQKPVESKFKRKFFDAVFLLGFLCCLVPGSFPQLTTIASAVLVLCIVISFFDENFYIYAALFMFMRYKMLIGGSPAFRIYSYLVVIRFVLELPRIKFRMAYLPAIFVFLLHSIFATPAIAGYRIGFNVIVDCSLVYLILLQILPNPQLTRKYMMAFLLGGLASGVYGWTNDQVSVDINVRGAGNQTVNRNFGALGDANFAGLFYGLCIVVSLVIKQIPRVVRIVLAAVFAVLLLQTASLSGIISLLGLLAFLIILKYRSKSIFILGALLIVAVIALVALLSIPQFREIEAIAGLIIRIEEKLSYIPRGRWDLLTTDRSAIWEQAINLFFSKNIWGMLVGGSVITVMATDLSVVSMACHNSYLQSLLNFGVLGTLIVYVPLFAVFFYRISKHFSKPSGYENEDIKILQLIFAFAFIVFGLSVDYFIDWPYMMFYFI